MQEKIYVSGRFERGELQEVAILEGRSSRAVHCVEEFFQKVVLPVLASARTGDDNSAGDMAAAQTAPANPVSPAVLSARGQLAIHALFCTITASGRVLADAHWVTDTMSGAALGLGLASICLPENKRSDAPEAANKDRATGFIPRDWHQESLDHMMAELREIVMDVGAGLDAAPFQ
ncbi:hypothetical protein CYMTET_30170 [Cymbomonas tetramitiformis]|uniref:Uncharacterized protein n=1 Tax=Cymbomonas tetramitiformis TaxID=36881 RepID=A0AAE0KU65_9CHLO|nr:hypothetical protein CYMTET_30170 [Cymbomonas tetramitiformis]